MKSCYISTFQTQGWLCISGLDHLYIINKKNPHISGIPPWPSQQEMVPVCWRLTHSTSQLGPTWQMRCLLPPWSLQYHYLSSRDPEILHCKIDRTPFRLENSFFFFCSSFGYQILPEIFLLLVGLVIWQKVWLLRW